MAQLEDLDFETGITGTGGWDSVSVFNSGTVTQHADAAHGGSNGSKHYLPTPGAQDRRAYGVLTLDAAQGGWYALAYFKINDLTMADGDKFTFLYLDDTSKFDLERSGATYQLLGLGVFSGTSAVSKTNWVKLEMHVVAETGESEGDGIVYWWVDDVAIQEQTNDTGTFETTWQTFQWGVRVGTENGTEGSIYIDDVEYHDGIPSAEDRNISVSECE